MNAGLPEGYSTRIYQKGNKKMHGLEGLHLAGLGRNVLRPYGRAKWRAWRRQRLGVSDAGAFYDGVDGVGGDVAQGFGGAIGPADFDGVHFRGGAQAEVQTQIVLGEIAGAAAHFAELFEAAGMNSDARADCGAIAFGADQFEEHAMI
jgi:hypothetical protein